MDLSEVVHRLNVENRAAISRATRIPYDTLCRIADGRTKNPRVKTVDTLRSYFVTLDVSRKQ